MSSKHKSEKLCQWGHSFVFKLVAKPGHNVVGLNKLKLGAAQLTAILSIYHKKAKCKIQIRKATLCFDKDPKKHQ